MPQDFDDDFPELTDEQAIAREEEMKSRQEFREWRKKYLELPADEQKWLSEQPKLVQDYYYAMPLKERGRKIRDEMRYERREKEVSEFLRSKIAPTKIAPTKENPSSETDLRTDLEDLDFAIDKFAFETTWAQPELKDTSMANLHWLAPEWQHQLRQWGQRENVIGNPPAWASSERIWDRAKKVVKPYWRKYRYPYKIVAKVFKQMGGKVKHKKKS